MGKTLSQTVYGNLSMSFNADGAVPGFFIQRGYQDFVKNGVGDYTFELEPDQAIDATEAIITSGIPALSDTPLMITVDPVDSTHIRVRTWLGSISGTLVADTANVPAIVTYIRQATYTHVGAGAKTGVVSIPGAAIPAAAYNVYPACQGVFPNGVPTTAQAIDVPTNQKTTTDFTFYVPNDLNDGDILKFLVIPVEPDVVAVIKSPANITGDIVWTPTDVNFWVQLADPGNQ